MKNDVKNFDVIEFAFLGDAYFSLLAREFVLKNYNLKMKDTQLLTTKMVRASFQAKVFDQIFEKLTEQEKEIANRARNHKTNNVPKSSNLEEYKKSTSLESIFGFNFLSGNKERCNELFEEACKIFKESL